MPSPFPGMDPWLERPAVFGGVQLGLVVYLKEAINAQLSPGYVAAIKHFDRDGPTADPHGQPYLEILTVEDECPVTAVQFLLPANKQEGSPGHTAYGELQKVHRANRVNLVEIDLLRGGTHVTAVPREYIRKRVPIYDYHICATRIEERITFGFKTFTVSDHLPTISVPLIPFVNEVQIDLQPLLNRVYDAGRHSYWAKYATKSPDPALTPEQQAWADAILKEKA